MRGVWLLCQLPRSLVEQFEAVAREDGKRPGHAVRAALVGFLMTLTPEQRAAAMRAVDRLMGRPRPHPRRKKDPALGLAIQLKIKHPDRMIG